MYAFFIAVALGDFTERKCGIRDCSSGRRLTETVLPSLDLISYSLFPNSLWSFRVKVSVLTMWEGEGVVDVVVDVGFVESLSWWLFVIAGCRMDGEPVVTEG